MFRVHSNHVRRAFLPAVAGVAASLPVAHAQEYTFTRIVDTNDLAASGVPFAGFTDPALRDGRISFTGFDPVGGDLPYTTLFGTLDLIADTNTPVPAGDGNFSSFIQNTYVTSLSAVISGSDEQNNKGIYEYAANGLSVIVDEHTTIPGGASLFSGFATEPWRFVGSDFAFEANYQLDDNGINAVFARINGNIIKIVDELDTAPSGIHFQSFDNPVLDGSGSGACVVRGTEVGQPPALYTVFDSQIETIVQSGDAVPGGEGGFASFSTPWIEQGDVIWVGADENFDRGIYARMNNGPVEMLIDKTTVLPGGGFVADIDGQSLAFNDAGLSFYAIDSNGLAGLYLSKDGVVSSVVRDGDLVDGKTVLFVDAPELQARDGESFAVTLFFSDASWGIYVADPVVADCLGDFNDDGMLNILDFVAFQNAFSAQDPGTDCTDDEVLDILDFICFQAAFQAGCD